MSQPSVLGRQAEAHVENLLLARGWKLLDRRFRRRFGEIDLIFEDRDTCVFIEVRCRSEWTHGRPADTVDHRKCQRLARLALAYLTLHRIPDRLCRFDVAEVRPEGSAWEVTYWQDAFRPDPPGRTSRY